MISKRSKQILLYITFAVLLYGVVMNLSSVLKGISGFMGVLIPVFAGIIFAFVLNVPMNGLMNLARKASERFGFKLNEKLAEPAALIVTLVLIVFVFYTAIVMLFPPLKESVRTITPVLQRKIPVVLEYLKEKGWDANQFYAQISTFTSRYSANFSSLFTSAYSAVSSTFANLANISVGLIIDVYVLLSKTTTFGIIQNLIDAFVPDKTAKQIYRVADLVNETYSKFLVGQTIEAFILGGLMFAAFWIFRLPYPLLVGVLTGVSAFIPYLGALVYGGMAVLLCVLTSPEQAVLCLIVYVVTQFIENQFIYPRVVGTSVGLSPLLTLLAALIGGSFFGLLGILFFIPLVACVQILISEQVDARLAAKKAKQNTGGEGDAGSARPKSAENE